MRLKPLLGCFFISLFLVGTGLAGQTEESSLGEFARKERERKQAQSVQGYPGKTAVASESVGLRLLVPQGWKVRDLPDPVNSQLLIDCAPEHPSGCWLIVKSTTIVTDRSTIADADRQAWESTTHPRTGEPLRRLSSRDLIVASYPAFEVVAQSDGPPEERVRTVHVLARDVGRLFEFSFGAAWGARDRFNEYVSAVDAVLKSFSPLGRASRELSGREIPKSLKATGHDKPK